MVLNEGGDYQKMIAGFDPPQQEAQVVITETPQKFGWVHRHPYLASTVAIIGLLFLGSALFLQRSDVAPSGSSGAWGGAGGLFFANLRAQAPYRPGAEDVTRAQSAAQQILPFIPVLKPGGNETGGGAPNDIEALLALLVQTDANTSASGGAGETPGAYAFIPQGLITVESVDDSRTVVPGQESSLREYGNHAGTYIQDFENTHRTAPQILKNHVEDRANPQKIAALERLAYDMQEHGRNLLEMEYVPESASGIHRAYANAYRAAGFALRDVAQTTTDAEFIAAIGVYNATVEELTKRFLMLVALFGANNVTFSSSEPGSVFMFSANMNASF